MYAVCYLHFSAENPEPDCSGGKFPCYCPPEYFYQYPENTCEPRGHDEQPQYVPYSPPDQYPHLLPFPPGNQVNPNPSRPNENTDCKFDIRCVCVLGSCNLLTNCLVWLRLVVHCLCDVEKRFILCCICHRSCSNANSVSISIGSRFERFVVYFSWRQETHPRLFRRSVPLLLSTRVLFPVS